MNDSRLDEIVCHRPCLFQRARVVGKSLFVLAREGTRQPYIIGATKECGKMSGVVDVLACALGTVSEGAAYIANIQA